MRPGQPLRTSGVESRPTQASDHIDVMAFELVKQNLRNIADEMAIQMMRGAFSGIIRDVLDFSTAIFDRSGRMLSQGLSLPLHLGSMPDAIDAVRRRFDGQFDDGDVIILNDPYFGGMHLPDIFMFKPVFYDGRLRAFSGIVAHHADIGGRVPGGSAADSREIFEEGLRIPPAKLYQADQLNEAMYDVLETNNRVPHLVMGDIRAQLAGCRYGENGLVGMFDRYGVGEIERYFDPLLDYSEQMTASEIATWPDGEYWFEDFEDHDGISPSLVPIRVTAKVKSDKVFFDFSGSAAQVDGAINATPSFVRSAVYAAVRSLIEADVPNNAGSMRPIHVQIPEGSVLNPNPPAACAARGVIGFRTLDAVFGALAQALPDRVPAAGDGGTTGIRLGGRTNSGQSFQFIDPICGSWGGKFGKDGFDGVSHLAVNISNPSIEIIEAEEPVRVHRHEMAADSGGAGQFRGGLAIKRELELVGVPATLALRSHRRDLRPWGLNGGHDGSASLTYIAEPGEERQLVPTKFTTRVPAGTRIYHQTAGGGGWGDPLDRDVEAVASDVYNEKLAPEYARETYGVVLNESGEVDVEASRQSKAKLTQIDADLDT